MRLSKWPNSTLRCRYCLTEYLLALLGFASSVAVWYYTTSTNSWVLMYSTIACNTFFFRLFFGVIRAMSLSKSSMLIMQELLVLVLLLAKMNWK